MNRREFLTGGLSVTIVGCGQENEVAQEYELQPSPILRTSQNVFSGGVEDAWTPTIVSASGGDFAATYYWQRGRYVKIGSLTIAWFAILTSSYTHSTSFGEMRITGLPFPCYTIPGTGATDAFGVGSCLIGGATLLTAGVTQVAPRAINGQNYFYIAQFNFSGGAISDLTIPDVPNGGQLDLRGNLIYLAENQS